MRRVAFLGSTTSSVIAEASAPDHDTYSLDGISVAESEAERQGFEWWVCAGRGCCWGMVFGGPCSCS